MPEASADPLIGKVLNGHFSIVELIGSGGMGRVYKAVQSSLDRVVALKVLHPHRDVVGRDPNFHRRFFLEASLTSKLRHPNTITVIDYGQTPDGIYYIAMEYLEGRTLSQVLSATGPFGWQRALHITQQICRSLREAHRAGVVHRDLKPANVMLLSEDADQDLVKVLDFGLVKPLGADDPAESEITQAGMMLGSPMYMAPEQARNHSDARSDVYSLGVVAYQMLMGRPPFTSPQSVDVILKHINDRPPPFKQLRPDLDVPAEIEAVVMRCLEKDPARRFQSMEALLEALRQAALVAGGSSVLSDPRLAFAPRTPAPVPAASLSAASDEALSDIVIIDESPPLRRKFLFGAIFVASIALGGAAVWFLRPSAEPPAPPAVAAPTPVVAPGPSAPMPAVPTPAAAPPSTPPLPAPVRFRVRSQPAGAVVTMNGERLGTSPLTWEVLPGEDGTAEATFTLQLDGYEPVTGTVRGSGPEIEVERTLKKRESPRKKPSRGDDDGYKDDPYL